VENKPYVVVRSSIAGDFAGHLVARDSNVVELRQSRRLVWCGGDDLNRLAVDGASNPSDCKFSMPVSSQTIFGIAEIIVATEAARLSIEAVPVWSH
jgi:hypothetical protein